MWISEWMNLFSIKMRVDFFFFFFAPSGCCKSCARIPKLHRKILNSESCILCWPRILLLPLRMLFYNLELEEVRDVWRVGRGWRWSLYKSIFFPFLFSNRKVSWEREIKSCFIASPPKLNYPLALAWADPGSSRKPRPPLISIQVLSWPLKDTGFGLISQ